MNFSNFPKTLQAVILAKFTILVSLINAFFREVSEKAAYIS